MGTALAARWRIPLVGLGSTLFALACAEIGLRYVAHRANAQSFEAAYSAGPPQRASGRTALVDLLRPSRDEKIVYELRPNLAGLSFKGGIVSTNSHGFRCAEVELEKQPGEIVVVGLGDSGMFGHGVSDGEPYMCVLGELLAHKYPQRRWKLINSGVPGYNTVMEVETLRTRLLQFQPDVVVLDVVLNDLELPVYLRATQDVFDLRRSFLVDLVGARLGSSARSDAASSASAALSHTPSRLEAVVEPEQAELTGFSEQYRAMIGIGAYRTALDELAALSREHGFEVFVWSLGEFAEPVPQLLEEARARGFRILSLLEEMRTHVETKYHLPLSFENQVKTDLAVDAGNAHPSVLLHQMAARKLVQSLEEAGTIDALIERSGPH